MHSLMGLNHTYCHDTQTGASDGQLFAAPVCVLKMAVCAACTPEALTHWAVLDAQYWCSSIFDARNDKNDEIKILRNIQKAIDSARMAW